MNITRGKQRSGLSSSLLRASLFSVALGTALLLVAFFLLIGVCVFCTFVVFPRIDCGQQVVFGLAQLKSNELAATLIGVIGEHSLFVRVLNFTFIVHFTKQDNS